jgi:hypothetical protein
MNKRRAWRRADARWGLCISLTLLACAPLNPGAGSGAFEPVNLEPGSLGARVVGCWELTWGNVAQPSGSGRMAMPDSVSLDAPPLFGARGRRVSPATRPDGRGFDRPLPPPEAMTWEQRYRVNRWWVDEEVVEVVFSEEERTFWSLRLRLNDGVLSGPASYYERTGPERTLLASVDARRFACAM